MKIIGIDVSTWQGEIDWNQVKDAGINYAILRSSFGSPDPSQIDNQFENNYQGAKRWNPGGRLPLRLRGF